MVSTWSLSPCSLRRDDDLSCAQSRSHPSPSDTMERVREALSRLASSMPSGGGPGPMGRALGLGAVGLTGLAYGGTNCIFNVAGGERAVRRAASRAPRKFFGAAGRAPPPAHRRSPRPPKRR